jgi:hypothetical protein
MRSMLRRLALIVLSGLFLLALGTYIAGEQTEVAVLRTHDDAGVAYDTKMWIVDVDGNAYVRIGRPGRGWGERAKSHPDVELIRGDVTTPCIAAVVDDATLRRRVDDAFAAKYGWVDWWYGVVVRTDPVVALRLEPRAPEPAI